MKLTAHSSLYNIPSPSIRPPYDDCIIFTGIYSLCYAPCMHVGGCGRIAILVMLLTHSSHRCFRTQCFQTHCCCFLKAGQSRRRGQVEGLTQCFQTHCYCFLKAGQSRRRGQVEGFQSTRRSTTGEDLGSLSRSQSHLPIPQILPAETRHAPR